MPKVKCVDCGYLAVHHPYDGSVIVARKDIREQETHVIRHGNFPPDQRAADFFCYKNCSMFSANHKIPMGTLGPPKGGFNPNAQAIREEIECDFFVKWIPGKTPKEHEEMAFLQQIRAESAAQREDDLRRQKEWRNKDLERQNKFEVQIENRFGRQILFGFLIALMTSLFTLFGKFLFTGSW